MSYFNKGKDKFLRNKSEEQIDEEILESKAIPELKLKYMIFVNLDQLGEIKDHLVSDYLNFGTYNRSDIGNFCGRLIRLYGLLKYMILVKIGEIKNSKPDQYERDLSFLDRFENLQNGVAYPVRILFQCEDFLQRYLHLLKLTDLLQKEVDQLDEFEKQYS